LVVSQIPLAKFAAQLPLNVSTKILYEWHGNHSQDLCPKEFSATKSDDHGYPISYDVIKAARY
jgi:hypothetical protein